jgi:hypothetical protein
MKLWLDVQLFLAKTLPSALLLLAEGEKLVEITDSW